MADKSQTIKSASDKDLDMLIARLRKERELQGLISDLKRTSSINGYSSYEPQYVSTEEPIESMYHGVDDVLAHFGIRGMRWGVRNDSRVVEARNKKNKAKEGSKDEGSDDYKASRELKAKGVKNLSTKELKDLTQRMQLEKQLRDLKLSDYSKGMSVVKTVTAAGTTVASLYGLSQTPLGKRVVGAAKGATTRRAVNTAYKKAMGG